MITFNQEKILSLSDATNYSPFIIQWALRIVAPRLDEIEDKEWSIIDVSIYITQDEKDKGCVIDDNHDDVLKWLCNHCDDSIVAWHNLSDGVGADYIANPFEDACSYQVQMLSDIIEECIRSTNIYKQNRENLLARREFILTKKDIRELKSELGIEEDGSND